MVDRLPSKLKKLSSNLDAAKKKKLAKLGCENKIGKIKETPKRTNKLIGMIF